MTNAELRRRRRNVRVPGAFRKRIWMILAMLLCSGILVGLASYAWFTLSSAPELVGITATVGANGSLEVALLNNETGENTSLIEADVGDAISIVGAAEGNITWGNLVDLSDASYGLNTVVLYPSLANESNGVLDTRSPLKIPKRGPDGRVERMTASSFPAIYNGAAFTTKDALYGVRAIGALGDGSSREGYLESAKRAFETSRAAARAAAQTVISTHDSILMSIAISQMGGLSVTYGYEQVVEIQVMMAEIRNALNYAMTCYKQAIIATAAADEGLSDGDFDGIRRGVAQAKGNEMSAYAGHFPPGVTAADLTALQGSISKAELAVERCNYFLYKDYGTPDQTPVPNTTRYTAEELAPITDTIANGSTLPLDEIRETYVITLTATQGEGLLTDIADYVGNYSTTASGVTAHVTTVKQAGNGLLSAISLEGLQAPAYTPGEDTNNSTVSEFYGYMVDLAFRCNVSTDLRLQSAPVDRIYTDGAGATAGTGSRVTYSFAAGMSDEQVKTMLSAVRVVFFDPDSGQIFARARLAEPSIVGVTAKADLYLTREDGSLREDGAAITRLDPIVPKKVSVLVYLDGTAIDNNAVLNGDNVGSMLLNLQFGSSVKLTPMDDDLRYETAAG